MSKSLKFSGNLSYYLEEELRFPFLGENPSIAESIPLNKGKSL